MNIACKLIPIKLGVLDLFTLTFIHLKSVGEYVICVGIIIYRIIFQYVNV